MKTYMQISKKLWRTIVPTAAFVAAAGLLTGCESAYDVAQDVAQQVVRVDQNQLTVSRADGFAQTTSEVASDATIFRDGEPAALSELRRGDAVNLQTEQRNGKEVVTQIQATSQDAAIGEQPAPQPAGDTPAPPIEPASDNSGEKIPDLPRLPKPPIDRNGELDLRGAAQQSTSNRTAALASYSGTIKNLQAGQIVVVDKNGATTQFTVNDDTTYTLDGKAAKFADLKTGQAVSIMAERTDDGQLAKMVAANSETSQETRENPAPTPRPLPASYVPEDEFAASSLKFAGNISKVGKDKLTAASKDGQSMTFTVNDQTAISLDGKAAKLSDLKIPYVVSVTYQKDGETLVASVVAARSSNVSAIFVPARDLSAVINRRDADDATAIFSGTISKIGDAKFAAKSNEGKEHTFAVNDETTYSLDGRKAKFADLKTGQTVTVTFKGDVATMVAAKSGT